MENKREGGALSETGDKSFPISPVAMPTKMNKEAVISLYFKIRKAADD